MIKKIIITVLLLLFFIKKVRNQFENRIVQQTNPQTIDSEKYPIFKAYPVYQTSSLEFCNLSANSFVQYFKYGLEEYFALSLKQCGFNVFNLKNPSNPKLEVNFPINSGKIYQFSFDSVRNILWIAHSEGKIFYIEVSKKPFKVELAFQTNNQAKSYFVRFIDGVNNGILVFCFNEIQIFQFEGINQDQINQINISSIKYLKSIPLNNSFEVTNTKFVNNLLFISTSVSGLQIYLIDKSQTININLTYMRNIQPNQYPIVDFQITSSNIIYLQPAFGGTFSYNANDCITKGDAATCKNILLIENRVRSQRAGNMYQTKDKKYIITHFSSIGIQILDISSTKMKNFQTLDYRGEAISLAVNESESLIIQSGSTKVQIYLKQKSKISLDKPNILLHIIQNVEQTFYRDPYLFSPEFDCFFDSLKDIVYVNRGALGLVVIKKNPQGVLKTVIKLEESVKGQSFGPLRFFLDSTLAYVLKGFSGLSVINFKNPEQPDYVQNNLKFGALGTFYQMECTIIHSLCAIISSGSGVIFLDITNLLDPKLLQMYPLIKISDSNIMQVYFLKTKKVVIFGIDQYGVVAFNLDDPKNPSKISSLYLADGTGLIGTSDDKFLFAASSYKGVSIIDISDLQNLKVISYVSLFGRIPKLYLMSNEKYLLVPATEKPALFLIDIQDKFNPILLQTLMRNTIEGFQSICFDKDQNEGFITTGKPLIQTNFKNQVAFSQQIYELTPITGSNEKNFLDIDLSSPLQVGQVVNVRLVPLNIDSAVSIKKVMMYEDYILQPIKYWMVFQSQLNLLQLTLVKDALQQDKLGNYIQTSQYVIFQSHIALDASSFINSFLNIDITLSSKILFECQKQGYIDETYMVNENLNLQGVIQINFDKIFDTNTLASLTSEKKDDIINAIRYVFKHSIVYYPIEFIVVPSISFNLKNQKMNYIKSLQKQVTLYIRVSLGQGRFVNKNYAGVLSIFSQQQDEIKIEGDKDNLNDVLRQKIKFSSIQSNNNIQFFIKIQDSYNYDIDQKVSYEEALFISEQSKVNILNEQSIKNDFSTKFEDSSIYIKERFSYQIPIEIFDCEDLKQLEFSAKIKDSDGEFNNIPQGHWLQFSQKDRIFSGMPTERSEFNQIIKIQVKITDQYSFITQEFEINVSKIPFSYILQIFIQIIGPLLGVLGIWKYKYKMYNLIQKKNYTYSKELINAGKCYQKQILLNNWNIEIANKILDLFKQTVSNKEILSQIYLYQSSIVKSDTLNSRSNIQKLMSEQSSPVTIQETCENSSRLQTYFQSPKLDGQVIDEVVENSSQELSQKNIKRLSQLQNIQKTIKQPNNPQETMQLNCFSEEQIFKKSQLENKSIDNSPYNQTKENSIQDFNEKQQKNEQFFQRSITMNQTTKILDNQTRRRQSSIHNLIASNNQQNTQKRFRQQLKKQIEKVTQVSLSQLEQSKLDENAKSEIRQKSRSVQRSEMWMLDSKGYLNYSQIIQYLISHCKNQKIKNKIFKQEILDQLLNKNGLLRQTFQCFLAEFILQKDTFSYNVFKELYNRSQQSFQNPQWYNVYCSVSANIDNIHINPVRIVEFDDSMIEDQIKQLIFDQNQDSMQADSLEKLPFSLHLVKETIKAYALGFISNSVKLKALSSGESLHIESYNIKQIISKSQKVDNFIQSIRNGLKYQCNQRENEEFTEKPLVENFKLPPWIKSVEIINNNLLIEGTPQNKDIGKINFFIYNKSNLIVRAFEIEVVGSQLQENSLQVNEPNQLITTDKNDEALQKFMNYRNQTQQSNQVENEYVKPNFNLLFSERQENQNEIDIFDEEKQPHVNQFTF